MAVSDTRWHQLGDPVTDAEAAALATLRDLLPDSPTTTVWSNVTFRDSSGRAIEIDVILLHRNGLYVIELKGWHGTIDGDQQNWRITAPNGSVRIAPDPFKLTEAKAKRIATELQKARWGLQGKHPKVPFVRAVTVLHGKGSRVTLDPAASATTFALDGYGVKGVRSIRELLDASPNEAANDITAQRAPALVNLIKSIGLKPSPKVRMVGQYVVEKANPLAEGPGWVDVRARHPLLPNEFRRLRLYDEPVKATQQERKAIARAAHREYALVAKLAHPGIVRPLEVLSPESGPALVFPDNGPDVSVGQYLAGHPLDAEARLGLIRQLGEVLAYAHDHGVTHRALTASTVFVGEHDGALRVSVRDWQTGRLDQAEEATSNRTMLRGVSEVAGAVAHESWPYLAPEAHLPDPDGVALDVYGLGALAYLLLTDAPPATTLVVLQERLAAGGLDPAVDRDGLEPELCDLVRRATHPDVDRRLHSVHEFLDALTAYLAARHEDSDTPTEPEPAADPRDAEYGSEIADRWIVQERLGTGGTGVALLVEDYDLGVDGVVLKVALNETAGERIREEAAVLTQLDHPRVVRLLDGPLPADGHTAIVVADAGRPTLGRRLIDEGAATLEQLENYGQDLFEAVAHLESRGVFHRDIKPENLGVREDRSDRTRHLVLFDFSLSSEPLEKVRSGTHGYLDPFLGSGARHRFDSAAERFAVAATLFEMATGGKPEWGDGRSDPAQIPDDVHLAESMFEPAVATAMVDFFARALARDTTRRFDDIASMAQAWSAIFPTSAASLTEDASDEQRQALADAATRATPLAEAGLTARAVSAARRLGAHTVGELMDISAFDINNLSGAGVVVRGELKQRRREWTVRLAGMTEVETELSILLRGLETTQTALVPTRRSKAAPTVPLARRLLNLDVDDDASPWPDLATAAAEAGLATDPADATAAVDLLTAWWARSKAAAEVLADVTAVVAALSGVATVEEIAERLVALRGSSAEGPARRRNAIGLVRAAVQADAGATLTVLRHGTQVLVTTADSESPDGRLEAAAALATALDAALDSTSMPPAPPSLLGPNVGLDLIRSHPRTSEVRIGDPQRVLTLAARASAHAAVSSRNELYPRDMHPIEAVAAVLAAAPGRITAKRLRDLAAARFPAAQPIPTGAELQSLVAATGSTLTWDAAAATFVRARSTTSELLSTGTVYQPERIATVFDEADESLRASLASRSAVVLTAPPHRLTTAPTALAHHYGARVVDVTAELIRAMRTKAAAAGVDWTLVLRADAAAPASVDRTNLERLVAHSTDEFWPTLLADSSPLLLTEVAPLARYGQLDLLATILDTATARPAARWILVPKRAGAAVPTFDGTAIPLASGTWIELPATLQEKSA